MRTLGTWLLLVSGLTVGVLSAFLGGPVPVALALVTVLCGVVLTVAAHGGRGGPAALGLAVLLLGLARGHASHEVRAVDIEAGHRGQPVRLREIEVVSASIPGPRCRVAVRPARGAPLDVALPAELCPLWRGERVAVLADALHTDTGRLDPQAGPVLWISRAWRRSSDAPVSIASKVRRHASEALSTMRQTAWDASRGMPGRGFVVASSLGLPRALPGPVRGRLRRAGIGHLIAVSGLHVGLAAWLWLRGLRWVLSAWWWGARAALVASAIPVAAYVILTGAAAPAVRAATMFGVVSLGAVSGRPVHGPTVLAVAVAWMLFAQPTWLLDPGFQLSVAAMAVLVGLGPGAGPARTSWHLGWALLPLLWVHFDASSDGSVVANVLVMPVFALWVVPWAVAGWAAMPLMGPAALDPAAAGGEVILAVADMVSAWPEIPRSVWLVGAALTWLPGLRRRLSPRGRAWLPNRAAALALLLVAASAGMRPPAVAGWVAYGGGRTPEVMAVDEAGLACVRDPTASAARWRDRLETQAVAAVVAVQLSPRVSIDDPAVRWWWRGLDRLAAVPARRAPACSMPSRAHISAALEICNLYSAVPTARRLRGGASQCWSAAQGAWFTPPLHSTEPIHDITP